MKEALASIAVTLALAPAASAEPFKVKVDQTLSIKLTSAPASIVVGNPAVAGIVLTGGDTILISGKKNGATNIVVLDMAGRTILSNEIAVRAPREAKLRPAKAS